MNKKIDNYTIIEILVVLMMVGILAAIGIGALNGLKAGGGVSSTVRTLNSQISLGRSYAVSKNRYVAVLLPDAKVIADGIYNDKTNGFLATEVFRQSRLCFVVYKDGKYKFNRWVDDASWVKWPVGVIVCANANFNQVINIEGGKTSAAIIFANTGALTHSNIVKIQLFRAKFNAQKNRLIYSSKERKNTGWELSVNPFTGRTSCEKRH